MIAGHFGFAAGVKSRERQVPLWALMVATVWLDVLFVPLVAAATVELALVAVGSCLYWRAAAQATRQTALSGRGTRAGVVMLAAGVLTLALDVIG